MAIAKIQQANPFEGWTTIEEAARLVNRKRSTVLYWIETGKVACFPIGPKVRVVKIDEIRQYSENFSSRKIRRNKQLTNFPA
ncbi:MAG: helix-turn-helix domain-containing protein [Anaerolineae bacterium]